MSRNSLLLGLTSLSGGYIIVKTLGGKGLSGDVAQIIQSIKGLPLFAWHPILVTSGLLFFAPLSWATINARKNEVKKNKRILLTQAHAATIFLAVASTAGGLYAIYTNKQKAGKAHLTSPHSKVGLAFVILILTSYISAFSNVASGKEVPNFNWNSKWHKWLGKAALVASGFAIGTGLYSNWGKKTFPDEKLRAALALCIIIPQCLVAMEVPSLLSRPSKKDK